MRIRNTGGNKHSTKLDMDQGGLKNYSAFSMYEIHNDLSRDIQRLLPTLFPLVMRKEYFDFPERDSYAVVHYIWERGERGVGTLVLCRLFQGGLITAV